MTINRYQRETVEFMPVTVTVDGEPVVAGVELAVTTGTARPDTWAAAETLDGDIGLMIEDYEPGEYKAWAKVTDSPEIPVIPLGKFIVE